MRTRCTGGRVTDPSTRGKLHSKDAERRRRDRRVQRGRDPEREDVARLDRIEDAVVPEAGGRVVRITLRLVLGEGRGGERVALGGGHRLPACLELLQLDGEKRLGC